MLSHAITADPVYEFAADVRAGLSQPGQKELLSKYLYDDVGSALFEVISVLPEYGLTRADERLLRRHAHHIVERLPSPVVVAELGSGSGKKTRWILQALSQTQRTSYCPIEISPAALAMCKRELGDIDAISIVGFEREYLDGLLEVAARREAGVSFLREIRRILQPGDALLLGTDLEKPMAQLLRAYDDPLGVTAAFNLNLLARMNRELDANFDLPQFEHIAKFNRVARSVEMHILSHGKQTVNIPAAEFSVTLQAGETIWTESSHKYSRDEIAHIAKDTGFRCEAQWIDEEWRFAENLLVAG